MHMHSFAQCDAVHTLVEAWSTSSNYGTAVPDVLATWGYLLKQWVVVCKHTCTAQEGAQLLQQQLSFYITSS